MSCEESGAKSDGRRDDLVAEGRGVAAGEATVHFKVGALCRSGVIICSFQRSYRGREREGGKDSTVIYELSSEATMVGVGGLSMIGR
jgi:hypothetical protein